MSKIDRYDILGERVGYGIYEEARVEESKDGGYIDADDVENLLYQIKDIIENKGDDQKKLNDILKMINETGLLGEEI